MGMKIEDWVLEDPIVVPIAWFCPVGPIGAKLFFNLKLTNNKYNIFLCSFSIKSSCAGKVGYLDDVSLPSSKLTAYLIRS